MNGICRRLMAGFLAVSMLGLTTTALAANKIEITGIKVLGESDGEVKPIATYAPDAQDISLTPAQMLEVTIKVTDDENKAVQGAKTSFISSLSAEGENGALNNSTVQYVSQKTTDEDGTITVKFRPRTTIGNQGFGLFSIKSGTAGASVPAEISYEVKAETKPMTLTAKKNSLAANSNEDATFVISPDDFAGNDYSGFSVYIDDTKLTENYTITNENGEILLTVKKAALPSTPSSAAVKVTHDGYIDAAGTISITTAVYTITFKNYDDTVLETVKTEDGQMPSCSVTPTRAEDVQNTYAFSGWQPELDVATADATYTAQYTATPKTYSITLNVKDGIIADGANITSYTCGTAVTLPVPTKTGYTFGGWYEDAECAGEPVTEISESATGDKTYYAKWTAETYTVTYNKNDGTIENESNYTSYTYGNGLTLPIPTKDGYHFGGWYANEDCIGVPVSMISKTATGNKTYWAKWLENVPDSYTITFTNGDEVLQSSEVSVGETPSYSGVTPTKEQDDRYTYTFSGWDPEIEAVTKAATYEAQFTQTPRTYTVTLNADGGIVDGDVTTYTYGTGVTLPTNVTKTGYTFDGWYDSSDNRVLSISSSDTGDKTYTAKWTANTYTVTLNVNGGTLAENLTSYTYGEIAVLPTPTRDDYTFNGWYENAELTGSAVTEISASDTGNKTYWAKWTANTYTVTLNVNGGTLAQNLTAYTYGVGAVLPIPTKDGYHFGGWYANEDCTGNTITEISKTATGNKTYWAKWLENAPDAYIITFMNGDEVLQSSEVSVGETPSYSGVTPTKEQDDRYTYTFSGWDPEIEAVTKAATYEAQFTQTPRTYTVTLNADGGIVDGDVTTYTYGTGVTLPTNVTKTGYTFEGWYDSSDNRVLSISASDTGDKTYTAKWTANTYTVTLNVNSGTLAENLTAYTYGVGAVLPIPTRDDYSFDGWYDNEDCTGNAITEISAAETGDKTYYAKWTKNINKKIVAVLDNFADKLTIEKIIDNGTVTLAITPKENTVLPSLALYCATYTEEGMLKTVNKISCSATDENTTVSFTEPQVETGESYKLMLWSENQEPVIPVITNATIGFFE